MYRAFIWLGLALCMAMSFPAVARDKMNVATTRDDLKKTQRDIELAKKQGASLKEKAAQAQRDMEPLQRALVSQAKDLREVEQDLQKLEREEQAAQKRVDEKQEDLKKRREEIAASLDAMVRLRQAPPEALIARPGKLKDTISAAQLLQHLSEQLQQQAAELQQELNALAEAQEELAAAKIEVESKHKSLLTKRDLLQEQLAEREKLFKVVQQDFASVNAQINRLGKQSKTLQDLLERLEVVQSKPQFAKASRAGGALTEVRSKSFMLPVVGRVLETYGQNGSRGVKFEGRADGAVLAPYDGEVVFTGPFLDYGRMVILRHAGGYHSLMAGMSQITVSAGQRARKGEPIGRLGKRLSDAQLYLEFRQNNKPVNPNGWFAGL